MVFLVYPLHVLVVVVIGWFVLFRSFQFLSVCWIPWNHVPARVVLLGLDNGGKTTLLHRLQFGLAEQIVRPRYHPSAEDVKLESGATLKMFDLGGHAHARILWRDYLACVDGVVFVIDCADAQRLREAEVELKRVLEEVKSHVPLLLLGNKVDLPNTMTKNEIANGLMGNFRLQASYGEGGRKTNKTSLFLI
jgi:small GTP-binding protein